MTAYHIIGDIHGQAGKLESLLAKLGYNNHGKGYRNPDFTTVFLGDFIDRGLENRRVLEIVRAMVDSGQALAVMGNHEFNALCFHTKSALTGEPLRPHDDKNIGQHREFLREFPVGHPETGEVIAWFMTLPLFLDHEDLRAIHACWSPDAIRDISGRLSAENSLNSDVLQEAASKDTEMFAIVESLLKGPELALPGGYSFADKDGNERSHIRVKWWQGKTGTYRDIALVPEDTLEKIPQLPLPATIPVCGYPANDQPVFFGHYWFTGTPQPVQHNITCLDYSAGKGGPLVAYELLPKDAVAHPKGLQQSAFIWA